MAKAYRPTSSNKRIPVEAESVERMPIATTSASQGSVEADATTKTFQDLPTELMEDILMKAVVAEVRDRNEAKCGWKQEARRVTSRMKKVCSRWSEILKTKQFQLQLQRHLGPPPLHLEVVAKHRIDSAVAVTTMNNEIFVLCNDETNALHPRAFVNVYDRNDLWKVKHVIQFDSFEEMRPTDIAACSHAGCLYVIGDDTTPYDMGPLVYLIGKQDENDYAPLQWLLLENATDTSTVALHANETLVVTETGRPRYIKEYKVNRYCERILHCELYLTDDILSMGKAIQKSNGNFFFESLQSDHVRRLAEIDADGYIVQQLRLPLCEVPCYAVDMHDRIMMAGPLNNVRMLDEQFQEIQVFAPEDLWSHPSGLHYDRKADEWMLIDDRKYLTVVAFNDRKPTDDNTDLAFNYVIFD